MNLFHSLPNYEAYIYAIPDQYSVIESSTLVVIPRGARVAIVQGELRFKQGYRLTLQEVLTTERESVCIEFYGYEVWHDDIKLYWYDSQPHPNNPDLALNHPHHKHVPPNIKHNRIPAPELRFNQPNLPFLIREVEQILMH
ncbi:MAG: DUF6516 family protein [Chloroflexota bacterium]